MTDLLDRLAGLRVAVGGARAAGSAVARFLLAHDADVRFVDDDPAMGAELGVPSRSGADFAADPGELDLLVVSPGFRPDSAVVAAARRVGAPVWGDVEFAWRVDASGLLGPPRCWLVVTGTNGKTTTTSMLEAILTEAGLAARACGNIGESVITALAATPRADYLAVEASSFQLFWAPSLRPAAGVVLNVAEDHLDWHGGMAEYTAAKAGALAGAIAIVGRDDAIAAGLRGPERTVAFTLGSPARGELGVVDGVLVDDAFGAGPRPIVAADLISPAGPPGRADALAASALALAVGVDPAAAGRALAAFDVGAHRGTRVAEVDGVVYVDDSKATNPHAAAAALATFGRVVWIAGGQLKGASVDELLETTRDRLAGVVVIGVDRDVIRSAIRRHASDVPTVTVFTGDDGLMNVLIERDGAETAGSGGPGSSADAVMAEAVRRAARLAAESRAAGAAPVEAVLLAPAAASLDMFGSYAARGDSFANAARALGER